jgi:hypothetical protein
MASGKSRIKALPWLLLMELAWTLSQYWVRLPKNDRDELVRLLKKSKGMPHNLTRAELAELRRIVVALDLKSAAIKMAPMGRKFRR